MGDHSAYSLCRHNHRIGMDKEESGRVKLLGLWTCWHVIFVSWELEGHYQYSTMFCWEPEGSYRCVTSMAKAPFWFSMEHRGIVIKPVWFSDDDAFNLTSAARWSEVGRAIFSSLSPCFVQTAHFLSLCVQTLTKHRHAAEARLWCQTHDSDVAITHQSRKKQTLGTPLTAVGFTLPSIRAQGVWTVNYGR